jgi:misacylated tRNA(Ala) deacylase
MMASDERVGRTARLELSDQRLTEFEALVLDASPEGIVLDRSAFYPGGGGQPPDHGALVFAGVMCRIVGARKGDDLYLLPAQGDPVPGPGTRVRGVVDRGRRFELMRTHSALHVLSGVVFRDFGALVTGGNMDPLSARLDFNLETVPEGFRDDLERLCNQEVLADRAIEVFSLPRQKAMEIPDIIRTATNLLPPEIEVVRIVDIVGLDTQADGGTHVVSTAQIGELSVTKVENKGKGFRRVRISLPRL